MVKLKEVEVLMVNERGVKKSPNGEKRKKKKEKKVEKRAVRSFHLTGDKR
jgi:hypothetical protein